MPPKTKVTKEMILDASFAIIRKQGHENLNARSIAKYLNCSTQPILYNFKTIDEIREAVYVIADEYHTEYIMPKENDRDPFLTLGLNYIRFAYEERNLFRFLFQSDKFSGKDMNSLLNDPELGQIIDVMRKELGVSGTKAKQLFMSFFCAAHGMASLLGNNAMEYDEKQCKKMLESIYIGTSSGGR
jgi:AcrR family transcriptional regulator